MSHPSLSSQPEGARGGGRRLTTMLEGEPGTLEPREELTLPGEVSGCWGEREGGRGNVRAGEGRGQAAPKAQDRPKEGGLGQRRLPRPLGPRGGALRAATRWHHRPPT